jgi:hypothetical protein
MAGQACGEMGDDLRSVFDHRALVRLLGMGRSPMAVGDALGWGHWGVLRRDLGALSIRYDGG